MTNIAKAIGILIALSSTTTIAQTATPTKAVQCQLSEEAADLELAKLAVIDELQDGSQTETTFDPASVQPFGFVTKKLSYIVVDHPEFGERTIETVVVGDYDSVKASASRTLGTNCAWERHSTGARNCNMDAKDSSLPRFSVTENALEPGVVWIACSYKD